ncbi:MULTISPECIES: MBL fold metallo-hydrolase [Bacteroides]|jgi:hydroxyacylglutathione hydrolase|uniref:MBL fold metallo-hydrolase n=1 Tax=Bacteroides TaxID=816 RepID=UPI000E49F4FE|nr:MULTISPECIES: MBL fold metallo-hydrolase [Bacteroides]RHL08529.1 MBL fold metallo-hydrolase [Bacteroides sp. AF39-11AC]
MLEIKRIVNSIFSSNSYLLYSDDSPEVWLIDAGDVDPICNYLALNSKKLKGVLLTHTHFDHIYGLNRLANVFPELMVYTSYRGKEGLGSDKLNMSRYNLRPFVFRSDNVEILQEGQEVQLWENVRLMAFETPGHDWSALCFKVGDAVFTGDSYLPQYDLITNFPKSNKEQAFKSLERIKELSVGCSLYPGHGDIVYA